MDRNVTGRAEEAIATEELRRSEREVLAAEYVRKIGYDPFEDDPDTTLEEVRQALVDRDAEERADLMGR